MNSNHFYGICGLELIRGVVELWEVQVSFKSFEMIILKCALKSVSYNFFENTYNNA